MCKGDSRDCSKGGVSLCFSPGALATNPASVATVPRLPLARQRPGTVVGVLSSYSYSYSFFPSWVHLLRMKGPQGPEGGWPLMVMVMGQFQEGLCPQEPYTTMV